MEVNNSYIKFLLQILNSEDIDNIDIEEELTINAYLTLLSLNNIEFSEEIEQKEKEQIDDFLRKLNNLKVKIQLKRKQEEINKLKEELINQYYENINILSIYIKDGIELENTINTMDANIITALIDKTTKDKMNKEYSKEDRNAKNQCQHNRNHRSQAKDQTVSVKQSRFGINHIRCRLPFGVPLGLSSDRCSFGSCLPNRSRSSRLTAFFFYCLGRPGSLCGRSFRCLCLRRRSFLRRRSSSLLFFRIHR